MDTEAFANIKSVSTWDSGGGVELDIIELADGRVLAISEEVVMLYDSIEDLQSGDPATDRPHIYL